uniref:C-type lectin domain-containing protein n=1 Tax=Myripristis murdjan TaxID=586833 RepID=A0A667WDF9_9TELE
MKCSAGLLLLLMFLFLHAYHFIEEALPWLDAQVYCREMFTDLATVEDVEEMNRLMNTSWIGLERRGPMRWMWSDGSGTAHFTSWREDEPNNVAGNEWCAEFVEGNWNDVPCDQDLSFVCYERESFAHSLRYFLKSLMWVTVQQSKTEMM